MLHFWCLENVLYVYPESIAGIFQQLCLRLVYVVLLYYNAWCKKHNTQCGPKVLGLIFLKIEDT